MAKANTLVNNGMPEGVSYKSVKPGDMLLVKWRDTEPSMAVVIENCNESRPHNYKGYVEFIMFDPRASVRQVFSVDGTQVIRVIKSNALELQLLHLEQSMSAEEVQMRA